VALTFFSPGALFFQKKKKSNSIEVRRAAYINETKIILGFATVCWFVGLMFDDVGMLGLLQFAGFGYVVWCVRNIFGLGRLGAETNNQKEIQQKSENKYKSPRHPYSNLAEK